MHRHAEITAVPGGDRHHDHLARQWIQGGPVEHRAELEEAVEQLDRLEALGYARRAGDHADRRRKLIRLTARGIEALTVSAMIFGDIRDRWARALGQERLADLEAGLRAMVPGETFRLDVPGWFGAG